jgi:predicted nucleotide-binding protein
MASRRPAAPAPVALKLQLPPAAIQKGIERLGKRIDELRTFDLTTVPSGDSPELTALSAAIKDTLERSFGENTSAFKRFEPAASLAWYPMVFLYAGGPPTPVHEYMAGVKGNIDNSVALLLEAQRVLGEDLADAQPQVTQAVTAVKVATVPQKLSRRVFVVHGHDDGAREAVARFLEKIGFEAIILHEQANQGRTVIEKIEAHGNVHFAVVLLTPDDTGCAKDGEPEPRARQNVLLELGYFIGRLGRDRVCALKRGTLEIPSDFAGVVWETMDSAGGWKSALGRELQAAGHDVDWNMVMRP